MNYSDFGLFTWLLLSADPTNGIVHSNATILASEISIPRKQAQHNLYNLRKNGYIYYPDTRGIKGPHCIYINKYPLRMSWGKNFPWFSNIFENSDFIGHEFFLAQLKVRNLPSIWHITRGICSGLSISGFGLSSGFVLDFTADFLEYQESIDKIRLSMSFCRWLLDFDGAFDRDFTGTFEGYTYNIHIRILKDFNTKKPPGKEKTQAVALSDEAIKDAKHRLALLSDKFRSDTDFNVFAFIGKTAKSNIPATVTADVLASVYSNREHIKDFWAYALHVLRVEHSEFNYAFELEKHYKRKADIIDIDNTLKHLKIVEEVQG